MKKFAVAAALLSAVVATPALAQNGEGHVEVRGGYITGSGLDDATLGVAGGYDYNLGDKAFAGVEIAGDKVLIDGAKVQFSSGARLGANLGTNGKLYATGGYTFGQIDDQRRRTGRGVDAGLLLAHHAGDVGVSVAQQVGAIAAHVVDVFVAVGVGQAGPLGAGEELGKVLGHHDGGLVPVHAAGNDFGRTFTQGAILGVVPHLTFDPVLSDSFGFEVIDGKFS